MAKKRQQIILTHGNGMPSADVIKSLKLGELLVQHATAETETALHTVMNEGENAKLVSFPSQDWVQEKIDALKIGDVNSSIESINTQVSNLKTDLEAADQEIRESITAATQTITEAYEDAIASASENLQGQIDELSESNEAIVGRLDGHDQKVAEIEADVATKVAQSDYNAKVAEIEGKVAAKVAQSDYDTKVASLEGSIAGALEVANSKVAQDDYDEYVEETNGKISSLESSVSGLSSSKLDVTAFTENNNAVQLQIQAINDSIGKLDDTYVTDSAYNTDKAALEESIRKAKTTLTEQSVEEGEHGIKVTKSTTDPNNYTIEAVNLASVASVEAAAASAKQANDTLDLLMNTSGATESIETIKDLIDWVDQHEDVKEGIATDIIELKGTVNGFTSTQPISAETQAIRGLIEGLDERIGDAEDSISAAESDITSLESRMGTAESGISNNKSEIERVEREYKDADNAQAATVSAIDGRLTTAEGEIDALQIFMTETVPGTYATKAELESTATTLSNAIETAESTLSGEIAKKADNQAFEALRERVTEIGNSFISSVVVENDDKNKIVVSVSEDKHTVTFNFDEMVIDGGSYEE